MAKNYKQVNDEKQSFIIYKSWEEAFLMLSNDEQAQMFRVIFTTNFQLVNVNTIM